MCARVPQRLEQRVGEAQREQVLDRLLAEIMVDPEGPLLGKGGGDRVVDLAAGLEVGAERLLERHAGPSRRSGPPPARPAMVGLNSDGAVDRKIASPSPESPIASARRGKSSRSVSVERRRSAAASRKRSADLGLEKPAGKMLLERLAARRCETRRRRARSARCRRSAARRAAARRHRARRATAAASAGQGRRSRRTAAGYETLSGMMRGLSGHSAAGRMCVGACSSRMPPLLAITCE